MAADQHKLSRREVLAGACAVPVLPLVEVKRGQPDRLSLQWQGALARYGRAVQGLDAVAHVDDDDIYDHALGRHNSALARLLRAPAPDLAAMAEKLDLILRHSVFELNFGEVSLAALQEDIRGFAGLPSRLRASA